MHTNPRPSIRQRGAPSFISLLLVILTGAIATTVAVSVLYVGISGSRDALVLQQAGNAKLFATACVENALESIRQSTAYLGNGNLAIGSGSCTYAVTDLGGESRHIVATGTIGTVVRRLTVVVGAINPVILISSWQESS